MLPFKRKKRAPDRLPIDGPWSIAQGQNDGRVMIVRSNAVHPGEIIRKDILPEAGLSLTAGAKALGVSRQMVHDILAGRQPLSAGMRLKVSRLFGSTPEFWMRLQADYDLKKAAQNKKVMKRVSRIVPVKPLEEIRA